LLRRSLISIFQEIVRKLGVIESLKNFGPGLCGRLRQNQISGLRIAADVDLVFGEAEFGGNSNGLTPAAKEDFCLGRWRHRVSLCYISCYIAKGTARGF